MKFITTGTIIIATVTFDTFGSHGQGHMHTHIDCEEPIYYAPKPTNVYNLSQGQVFGFNNFGMFPFCPIAKR